MSIEFKPWPKTTRLFRNIVVTEKIDGTNAAIHITPDAVVAQSRTRIITPLDDNFGFAYWVEKHADVLRELLGEGTHFGEWWGGKIQRGYGVQGRRFSLFNTYKHATVNTAVGDVPVTIVPVLYEGPFSESAIRSALIELQHSGSVAAPGFMQPEGICVFHTASQIVQKVTLDKEDRGKWEAA